MGHISRGVDTYGSVIQWSKIVQKTAVDNARLIYILMLVACFSLLLSLVPVGHTIFIKGQGFLGALTPTICFQTHTVKSEKWLFSAKLVVLGESCFG